MNSSQTIHAELNQAFSLHGRVAVVTGAASGIGRETAHVLAQAGARVVVADVNEAGLAETVALIVSAGGIASAHRADVSRREAVDALAEATVKNMDRIDIWVNAAGIILNVPIVDALEADIDRMIAINLKGVYFGCAAAGRIMKVAKRGAIINVSSGGGESAVPGLSIYSMTKAAVNMLTRTAAKELGPFGIRANAVAPGWIDTPMGTYSFRDESGAIDPVRREEGIRLRAQSSPLGMTGEPRDVALTILYLASDASRFVTGQIVRPNGGVAMP